MAKKTTAKKKVSSQHSPQSDVTEKAKGRKKPLVKISNERHIVEQIIHFLANDQRVMIGHEWAREIEGRFYANIAHT